MMPDKIRKYLIIALGGMPAVADRMLLDLHADDPRWDYRPERGRFTLREVVAHLADWEPIHLERLQRLRAETNPVLPDIDEGALADENDYQHSDPHGSLEWIRGGRLALVKEFESLSDAEWTRPGIRESVGPVTIDTFAAFISAHDGYHMRQIAQWLALAEAAESRT